jgi:Flp pilus assembly protein CpaB
MSRSRGDQIVITSLLGLVLVVAGMLIADGWRRSRPQTAARTPAEATAVEAHDAPAQPVEAPKKNMPQGQAKPDANGNFNM